MGTHISFKLSSEVLPQLTAHEALNDSRCWPMSF